MFKKIKHFLKLIFSKKYRFMISEYRKLAFSTKTLECLSRSDVSYLDYINNHFSKTPRSTFSLEHTLEPPEMF